jgi:hypothetical protein
MAVSNSGMTLYTNNNTQQNWSGTDGLDTEVSKDGGGSESWLVAKNGNETGTLTLSANMGTPKYFNFWMKSDWGAFYTQIDATLSDGTNSNLFTVATGGKATIPNLNPEISGDFKPSVLQIDQGSAGGTYDPTAHASVSINVDASSTGNIRAIVNHWIDGMWYGNGRTISGTPTGSNIFLESHELDVTSTNYDGCSVLTDAGLVYYTDVTDSTASQSQNATVVFYAKSTTDGTLNLNVSGASTYTGMSFLTSGTTNLNFLPTNSGFTMSGGSITGGGSDTILSGQTFSGVSFNNRTSSSIATTISDCSFNSCGILSVSGTLNGCSIKDATGTAAVVASSASSIGVGTKFTSTTNDHHAVELTGATTSITWNGELENANWVGTSGSPITPTSNGNEAIYLNFVSTGDVTLSVATGATIPTVRVGASFTHNVIIPAASYTLTLTNIENDTYVAIVDSTTRTLLKGETVTTGTMTYSHGGTETVDIMFNNTGFDPNASDIFDLVLPSADSSIQVSMLADPNYQNP